MKPHTVKPDTYGVMAAFDDAKALVAATRAARDAGYTQIDAYSPFPIEGLHEAVGFHSTRLPAIVLGGGIIGGLSGFGMQYYAQVIHYPLNIGGKPLNSWPAWIPITFEMTILFATFAAVLGMIALNGLPQLYHPVFNVSRFSAASRDQFFLVIESADPKFAREESRRFLETLQPLEVNDVPW
jgi:hypothetical protein